MADRTIIRDGKVYGQGKVEIPTIARREMGIKDGDSVRWIKESGTYLVEPVNKPRFRPIQV